MFSALTNLMHPYQKRQSLALTSCPRLCLAMLDRVCAQIPPLSPCLVVEELAPLWLEELGLEDVGEHGW